MTRLLTGLLCDHFVLDVSGKHSCFGVFDRIGAPAFETVHPLMYIVCTLDGEPNQGALVHLEVWTPAEMLLLSTDAATVQFSAEGRAMLVERITDLQLESPGVYTIDVEVNGRSAGKTQFEVYQL